MSDTSKPEFWMEQAIKALSDKEFDAVRLLSEKAHAIAPNDIEINLFYLKALIVKLKNASLHKLETNLDKSIDLFNEIKAKQKSGIFTFSEEQKERLKILAEEKYEFHEYVGDIRFDIQG